MTDFVYPTTDFDRIDAMAPYIGSFWSNVFSQRGFVRDMLFAKGQLENQTLVQLQELFDAVSRFKLPVFHRERWHFIKFLESDLNQGKAAALKYDGAADYDLGTGFQYGVPLPQTRFIWDAPTSLANVRVLTNRINASSLTMIKGLDFLLDQDSVIFRENPFDNPLVPVREIFNGNQVVDREAGLWAFQVDFDANYVFEQFGYVLQLEKPGSQEYKDLVNAVFDGLVEGTVVRNVQNFFEALTGAKLVLTEQETVEALITETNRKFVITDKNAYEYELGAEFVVSVGDVVHAGQSLTNTLQFFEFNRGQCPTPDEVPSLAIGRGFLLPGFFGDLVFENKSLPLIVEEDVDGFTKLSWKLGGFPGDIEEFFDVMHARGVADGETLANLLDQRENKVGEPTAANLPSTINPLQFLCENVLRNNYYMVKVETSGFGVDALGMNSAKLLRRIHQPHTAIIIFVELAHRDEPIIMDAPGTDTDPGYEESAKIFLGQLAEETIGPDMLTECVRIKLIAGRCE